VLKLVAREHSSVVTLNNYFKIAMRMTKKHEYLVGYYGQADLEVYFNISNNVLEP
jgi:hypothetical protein